MTRPLLIPVLLLIALATGRLCAQPRTEVLENGLTLMVEQTDGPEGVAACWLTLGVGSAHERPHERGAAHIVEHLALTGPERTQPGHDAIAALGLPVGSKRNAYTNLEHTAYWVVTEPERLGKALHALATVLEPTPATRESFERERRVVLAEYEEESPETRAQRTLLAGLFPGTPLEHRWPSVEPETLERLTPEIVNAFRARTYTPDGATLVVVSPLDPDDVADATRAVFAALDGPPRAPRFEKPVARSPRQPGRTPRSLRAVRAEQPGLSETEITLAWPGTFDGEFSLTQALAVQVLRHRAEQSAREDPRWPGSEPIAIDVLLPVEGDRPGTRLRLVQLSAEFPPDSASQGLRLLSGAVSSINEVPVTSEEVDVAIHALRARLEKRLDQRASRTGSRLASTLASEVGDGARTPARLLDLLNDRAPTVRPEMISDAARQLFDPERAVIAVQGPSGRLPGSVAMLSEYRLGLAEGLATPVTRGVVLQMDRPGPDASGARGVEWVSVDPSTGVLSAELAGGMLVRHCALNRGGGRVALRVTLAGLGAGDDPLALAALRALASTPDTTAPGAEALLAEARIAELDVRLDRTDDTVSLHLVTTPGDFELAARLLGAMLTHPKIDDADVRRWLDREEARTLAINQQPDRLALRTMEGLLATSGQLAPKAWAPLIEHDPSQAREALERALRGVPGSVGVAGDIDRERALRAISEAFAGLTLAGIGPDEQADDPRPPKDPIRVTARAARADNANSGGETAVVLAQAWPIPRDLSISEVRQLVVATSVLAQRLEEAGLTPIDRRYDLATIAYDVATPRRVALMVLAEATEDELDATRRSVEQIATRLARLGPTSDELESARGRAVAAAERSVNSEYSWASRLASGALTGSAPEEIARIVPEYASVSAVDCRERIDESLRAASITVLARPAED